MPMAADERRFYNLLRVRSERHTTLARMKKHQQLCD
jgi:hypothetical protein